MDAIPSDAENAGSLRERYAERPFIAFWELTRACDLVCKHCRASAQPERDARELDTREGKALLDAFQRARVPLVVLTGGDPAKRADLVELVRYGSARGLNVGLTPSATPLVTETLIRSLAAAGVSRLAVSIDGPDARTHDAFRGVEGSFAEALRILRQARAAGIRTQVNTTLDRQRIEEIAALAALVEGLDCTLWSVFLVVPTGRASVDMMPTPARVEAALHELAEIAARAPFAVKTTAAPHYRRVLLQRAADKHRAQTQGVRGRDARRVNEGRGMLFVSHVGDVFPSGFLPIPCGNVRTDDVLDLYRTHPVFRTLRNGDALGGRCGACEYRELCGGSRARAFALDGNLLAEDPLCAFTPPRYVAPVAAAVRRLPLV